MTHARRCPDGGRPCPTDDGFTLVEVLVATVVFVVLSTATIGVLITGLRAIRDNTDRAKAATIARSQIEYLRSLGTAAIPIGLTVGAVPAGESPSRVDARLLDPEFTIRTTSNWVGVDQLDNACTAASPGRTYLRVSVEVSSANLDAPVTVDTVVYPSNSYQLTGGGSAAISVVDHVGMPVSDVRVQGTDTLHPGNSFTLTTGGDGCLYLPQLAPTGSLVLQVQRSGYVARTITGTSATLQVATGNVSRTAFALAPASGVEFAGADPDFPIPEGVPVTWQFNTTGAPRTVAGVGAPVTDLWPEPSGMSAYAGICADADPLEYGFARRSYSFDPGATSVARLDAAPVVVRGLAADMPVTAHYIGSDGECDVDPVLAGRSDEQGRVRLSLPYGEWEFVAGGQTHRAPGLLEPRADGTPPAPVTVSFTIADLDDVCASASPSSSPPASSSPCPPESP